MNPNRVGILSAIAAGTLAITLHAGASAAGDVIASFDFEDEIQQGVDGWRTGGLADIAQWLPAGTDGWPEATLAVVDTHPDRWGAWVSTRIPLPEEAPLLGTLNLEWEEAYHVQTDRMRVTFDLFDADGESIGRTTWHNDGTSPGWAGHQFTPRSEELPVPPGAVSIQFSLVSGGPPEATGTYLLNQMTIRMPDNGSGIIDDGDNLLVPIATWDLDVPDHRWPEVPLNWDRIGPAPYVAVWNQHVASTGRRSLALIDHDPRNAGQWASRRFALAPASEELEFGFDIRTQGISGTWAASLHSIRQNVDQLNGQLLERIDALVREVEDGIEIDWVRVTESGNQPLDTTSHGYTERNPRGFWEIRRRFPVVQEAQSMRVSVRNAPDTTATGVLWFDTPSVHAVIPKD